MTINVGTPFTPATPDQLASIGASLNVPAVVNDLTTGGAAAALSAAQGPILAGLIAAIGGSSIAATLAPVLTGNFIMAPVAITSAITITPNVTGAVPFAQVIGTYIADGNPAHTVTIAGALPSSSDQGFNTSAGVENILLLLRTQYRVFYTWSSDRDAVPIATVAPNVPTIGAATAGNTSASVAFTPSGSGATATSFTATATPGGATATGSSSPINVPGLTNGTGYTFTVHATDSFGSSAESAASNSVTPNAVAPTITARSVANASPTHIDLVFSAAMDQTSGSTPAAGDFAVAGGSHAPSAFAWVDSTHATITVPTYAASETTTLSYTGGTNKLKSLVGATLLANFSGAAIVDNVTGGGLLNVRYDVVGSHNTETGSGPYTYTNAGGTFVAPADGLVNTLLSFAGDFEYRYTIGATGSTNTFELLGLSTNSTNDVYTGWPIAVAMNSASGASPAFIPFTSGSAGSQAGGLATANVTVQRFKRTGTTVVAQASDDNFVSDIRLINTWTGVSGTLFMKASLYASGVNKSPQQSGGA